MQQLPITRTECDCPLCACGCRTMPGALAPGDLDRIKQHCGETSEEWERDHFRLSDGAIAIKIIDGQPVRLRVPSIVPAQHHDGRCVFLRPDGRCGIHPVAPFGCAYTDTHMDAEEADRRVRYLVTAQAAAHAAQDEYHQACVRLLDAGCTARPLSARKAAYKAAFDEIAESQGAAK